MNAFIVPIGDEVLIGQIVDTNSAWIAQQLNLQGISVRHAMSVSDKHDEIIKSLQFALSQADVVFVTGGLGPTKDDITKKAIADMLGVEMFFHEETWVRIQKIFEKFGRPTGEAHYNQCYMPEGVTILTNNMGTAPGMWFETQGKIIISMPGVPSEMKYIMEKEALPRLKKRFEGLPIAHRTVLTAGTGETELAQILESFEENLPQNLKLAFLPAFAQVRLRLTGRDKDEAALHLLLDEKAAEMEQLVAKFAFGREEETLEGVIGDLLKAKKQTLATAESCTGGLIAHRITGITGASEYFIGSIVAYAYDAKIKHLAVKEETLNTVGAVSEECVKQMVAGAIVAMESDYAIAVSGIAGPNGGTPEKPVGTIWIAVGNKEETVTRKISLNRNRAINVEYAANVALIMLLNFIKK
jgi:nicotinamide-nucleotide amidase